LPCETLNKNNSKINRLRFPMFLFIRSGMKKLKSRKLWAAILGSVVLAAGSEFGISPDAAQWIATIITGYVLGQGVADAGQAIASGKM
jgi:hypothetical protein